MHRSRPRVALYVFMSPTIRERLFAEPWDKCFAGAEKGVAGLLESESDMSKTEQSVNLGQDRSENTPNWHQQPGIVFGGIPPRLLPKPPHLLNLMSLRICVMSVGMTSSDSS